MNAELLEQATIAIMRADEFSEEHIAFCQKEVTPGEWVLSQKEAAAVLRVAIKACAEIAHGWYGCEDEAENIEREIRALLTAAEAELDNQETSNEAII